MITDEKRREVAKELRELATPGCIRYAEEFYEELREIVAFDRDGSFDGVANSLADLIDRPIYTSHTKRNGGLRVLSSMWCANRRVRRAELLS